MADIIVTNEIKVLTEVCEGQIYKRDGKYFVVTKRDGDAVEMFWCLVELNSFNIDIIRSCKIDLGIVMRAGDYRYIGKSKKLSLEVE